MQEASFGRASFLFLVVGLALGLIALVGCGSASVSDPSPAGAGAGGVPAAAEIKLSALQAAAPENELPAQLTIPTFAGSTPEVATATSTSCPAGTACANYKLFVPASDPVTGIYSPAGTSYTIP